MRNSAPAVAAASSPGSVRATPGKRRHLWLAGCLALMAALPYLIAGPGATFIEFDDPLYILDNPVVRQGLSASGAWWALTTFHAANWHPLTWLSHLLDVSLFGLDARGHHLTSILLHAGNSGLLFVALRRLTGEIRPGFLVAALFAVHPLRVESVAWVSERKDVLAAFFFMLTLLAWERYVRRGGAARYALAAALLAAGLMAKPMLVTVPALLLLMDVWPLGRLVGPARNRLPWSRAIVEKLPLAALAAAAAVVTLVAQRTGGAVRDLQVFSPLLRVENALVAVVAYLGKIFWPADLSIFYPLPPRLPSAQVALAALVIAALSAIAVRHFARRPALAVGWCWYVGLLLPVIGIIQVGGQAMADRYTYLPTIGVFLALAWARPGRAEFRRFSRWVAPAAGLVVAALAAASVRQAALWRTGESVLLHGLSLNPGSSVLRTTLANSYFREGRAAKGYELKGDINMELKFFAPAIDAYQKMLAASAPPAAAQYHKLGAAYRGAGRSQEAAAAFGKAIELEPGRADAHLDLGIITLEAGRLPEARALVERHLALTPASAQGQSALGLILLKSGDLEAAKRHLAQAVALDGDLAVAHYYLAQTLLFLGDRPGALRELGLLRSLDPRLAEELGRRLR